MICNNHTWVFRKTSYEKYFVVVEITFWQNKGHIEDLRNSEETVPRSLKTFGLLSLPKRSGFRRRHISTRRFPTRSHKKNGSLLSFDVSLILNRPDTSLVSFPLILVRPLRPEDDPTDRSILLILSSSFMFYHNSERRRWEFLHPLLFDVKGS